MPFPALLDAPFCYQDKSQVFLDPGIAEFQHGQAPQRPLGADRILPAHAQDRDFHEHGRIPGLKAI